MRWMMRCAAMAVMAQIRPGFFLGGEARYFRKYDGLGLDDFAGQALFVGPTVFLKLSDRSRLTANWSFQAWGRSAGSTAALDLVNAASGTVPLAGNPAGSFYTGKQHPVSTRPRPFGRVSEG